jgi:predicted nucleic acid-binding protein
VPLGNGGFRVRSSFGSTSRSCWSSTAAIPSPEALEPSLCWASAATRASCSVAAGSAAALICDTGALLDYLVESAPDHLLFRNAIDQARTRYVPALVLAEVDYFLRHERRAMRMFMQDVKGGAFTYAPPSLGQLSRAMEIDHRYEDLGLGLVDASVVSLAEHLGVRRLVTRDLRHFAAVRLRDGSAFDLVVHPTDPDRS